MKKTREILTPVADAINTLTSIKECYERKIKPDMPEDRKECLRIVIGHIKLAIEAVGILDPIELTDGKCPNCKHEFSLEEYENGVFYHCPNCGQALLDWEDPEIVSFVERR